MIKTMLLSIQDTEDYFESQLNELLQQLDYTDIKFSVTECFGQSVSAYTYHALIFYQDK